MKRALYSITAVITGLFLLQDGYAQSSNDVAIRSLIDESGIQGAIWSLTIKNSNGRTLESINSNYNITPASNQKLFTTAAILDGLGADYTFETEIYGLGELKDGIWVGDLIIVGSGDPSISGFLYNDDREYVFKEFLNQLTDLGIQGVSGRIYSDVSLFDDQVYPKGWDWDDLSFYYGVEIGPLSFNNNAFDLEVFAEGEIGDKPRIEWYPRIESIKINNNQEIIAAGLKYDEYYRRRLGFNEYELASKLPKGYFEEESLSINDADGFFLEAFEYFLIQNGFSIISEQSSYEDIDAPIDYSDYQLLASHESKTLKELIEWTNKESDNFYTEMLLKVLGAKKEGRPGTFENGILAVRSFLGSTGVDTTFVRMKDGSGLASGNFTTTNNLSVLLFEAQSFTWFSDFFNSLSIAGIDGTLQHRFKGTPLYNNLRGKSGFKGGVRSLSGYMQAASGERVIVSIATNHFIDKVSVVDRAHTRILELIYNTY